MCRECDGLGFVVRLQRDVIPTGASLLAFPPRSGGARRSGRICSLPAFGGSPHISCGGERFSAPKKLLLELCALALGVWDAQRSLDRFPKKLRLNFEVTYPSANIGTKAPSIVETADAQPKRRATR
jgi:hypothetical protein